MWFIPRNSHTLVEAHACVRGRMLEPQDWVLQVPAHETLWATLVYALPEVWVINATAQSVLPSATIGY